MSGEEDLIFNLKTEVLRFAAAKSHRHPASELDITYEESISNAPTSVKAPQTKAVKEYVQSNISTAIGNYYTKTEVDTKHYTKEETDSAITTATSTLAKTSDLNAYAKKEDYDTNIFAHPITTKLLINELIYPGYYKYVGTDAFFTCGPDNVHYTNGLIKIEKQSNRIIQHVYATSYSTKDQQYKIDGREYKRYGYITGSGDNINKEWTRDWYVVHLPWRERNDLINTPLGANVSSNGVKIYECTAGYIIYWTQDGTEQKYKLTADQYQFTPICTFKKDLPIHEPFIFGNIIGHADIKITKNSVQVRSLNRPGEYIVGVNGNYFVPRNN